jgi:hypothetical protein
MGGGEGQENITPVWKVPRQCPLVLLVWVTCTFFFFKCRWDGCFVVRFERTHNTSDWTEERTQSVTLKLFLFSPEHLRVLEIGFPMMGGGFSLPV